MFDDNVLTNVTMFNNVLAMSKLARLGVIKVKPMFNNVVTIVTQDITSITMFDNVLTNVLAMSNLAQLGVIKVETAIISG